MDIEIVNKFLFPTPDSSYEFDSFPEELVWVPKNLDVEKCKPEEYVPCLLLRCSSARFLLLYFHSNAEDLGMCRAFCTVLREQFQVHVLVVEYPGYGLAPGGPCRSETLKENAFAAYKFSRQVLNWPADGIMIFGRSIGCSASLAVAAKEEVAGLVLVSPFISVKEVCKDRFGNFGSWLITEQFPNDEHAAKIKAPTLIVHGRQDQLIPCRHGEHLYNLCQGPKYLVRPDTMGHNSCLLRDHGYLMRPMLRFFSLPDYCFEEMEVPPWAFSPPEGLLPETVARNESAALACPPGDNSPDRRTASESCPLCEEAAKATEKRARKLQQALAESARCPADCPVHGPLVPHPAAKIPKWNTKPQPENAAEDIDDFEEEEAPEDVVFYKVPPSSTFVPNLLQGEDDGSPEVWATHIAKVERLVGNVAKATKQGCLTII